MRKSFAIRLPLLLALPACATPVVDQTTASFSEIKFTVDLNIFRGGAVIETSALALFGSAYGALGGAGYGGRDSDTAEGAAIGPLFGGTIGLTAGTFEA